MAQIDPGTKKYFIWTGVITLVIITLIIVLDIVFYTTRKFIFSPYKPQVPDSVQNSSKTLSKAVNPKPYYCPNGCPEDATGKPANFGQLNSTIQNYITSNLTAYKAGSPATSPSDWYYQ